VSARNHGVARRQRAISLRAPAIASGHSQVDIGSSGIIVSAQPSIGESMAEPDDNTWTPEDMRQWLQQEIRDLTKATELRVKDATDFVTAYALGKITPEEAEDRLSRYQSRWGDSPIPGVATEENTPNDEILRRLDDGLPPTVKRLLEERERKHRRPER
jgi:hypothetical protein